ncbi:hypothetical protein C7C46_22365 [Streptomyces tateyamensis]|uniref:Uncharacterized protein n=1 Tax=Streptomyces tateyamensis TaxID=565073 RepID=A0A2V4N1N1_9ACTN|nr:hypothetical protein [Streptomyces tateyamensis]PYC76389.1 hypothetical protein C7C46_22365 [Streptomyces tateyamensis]
MTTPQAPETPERAIPVLFSGLCDDAALFPPGELAPAQAVPAHLAHRSAWYADLVGPFLCGPARIDPLAELVGADEGLDVSLVVPEGSAGLAPALRAIAARPQLRLAGIEVPADRLDDAAEGVRRVRAELDRLLPEWPPGLPVAVELDRGPQLLLALDALEGGPYRAKFRTGGTVAQAFPGELELASFLYAAVYRKLPFKCTAGLHHAVRHEDAGTGFAHHGFLNVLLATHAALGGAEHPELVELLREQDGAVVAARVAALTAGEQRAARAAFTGFGTCSIGEPLADLAALGLVRIP